MGFGWGEHRCAAQWLARVELEIVFGESPNVVSLLSASLIESVTSWQRQPKLKLVIPFEEAKYSPPKKDVELPVVF